MNSPSSISPAQLDSGAEASSESPAKPSVSEAKAAANRANAQLSSGPRSEAGKAIVSQNAVKTALTGRTVLLPSDDAAVYQLLLDRFVAELAPVGALELALVQSLVDTRWRLDRIPALEAALLDIGLAGLAERHSGVDLSDKAKCEMLVRLDYEKQFRNLQLQESRLVRRREKEIAELKQLQAVRQAQENEEYDRAVRCCFFADFGGKAFSLKENGFEFSKEEFDNYFIKLSDQRMTEMREQVRRLARYENRYLA